VEVYWTRAKHIYWRAVQSGKNTTWKALADAMGATAVRRDDLKEKILNKYT